MPKRGIHRYLVFTFVSFNFISDSFRPVTSSLVTSLPFGEAGSSHWMWSVKSKIACFQFHSLSINVQNVILISFGQSTAFSLSVSSTKRFCNTPNYVHRFHEQQQTIRHTKYSTSFVPFLVGNAFSVDCQVQRSSCMLISDNA